VGLTVSAVEAPEVIAKFQKVKDSDNVLVTDIQVSPHVFGSNYAFCLIAQCLTVCSFAGSFFLYDIPCSALQGLQYSPTPCNAERSMSHKKLLRPKLEII